MAAPNRPPRSIRREADQPAGPRGRAPSQRVQNAADAGILTRGNTRPGTAGRRAVDAATYNRRRAARPGVSARESAGHAPGGTAGPSGTFFGMPESGGGSRLLVGVSVSRADIHRLGRYDTLVRQLLAGKMTPAAFERRVRGWRPVTVLAPPEVAGSYRFVADPAAAQALAVQAQAEGIEDWIDSGRVRPLPAPHRVPRGGNHRSSPARRRGGTGRATSRKPAAASGPGLAELFDEALGDIEGALSDGLDALGDGLDEL